jgi:hypothetical protein
MMPTDWAARNRHEINYRSYTASIGRRRRRPRTSVLNQARCSIEYPRRVDESGYGINVQFDVPRHERALRETRQRRSDEE